MFQPFVLRTIWVKREAVPRCHPAEHSRAKNTFELQGKTLQMQTLKAKPFQNRLWKSRRRRLASFWTWAAWMCVYRSGIGKWHAENCFVSVKWSVRTMTALSSGNSPFLYVTSNYIGVKRPQSRSCVLRKRGHGCMATYVPIWPSDSHHFTGLPHCLWRLFVIRAAHQSDRIKGSDSGQRHTIEFDSFTNINNTINHPLIAICSMMRARHLILSTWPWFTIGSPLHSLIVALHQNENIRQTF